MGMSRVLWERVCRLRTYDIGRLLNINFGTTHQRVAQGAQWLDAVYPEWVDHIDVEHLDIASGVDCICGQLFQYNQSIFGMWDTEIAGWEAICGIESMAKLAGSMHLSLFERGMTNPSDTATWKRLIEARRMQAVEEVVHKVQAEVGELVPA